MFWNMQQPLPSPDSNGDKLLDPQTEKEKSTNQIHILKWDVSFGVERQKYRKPYYLVKCFGCQQMDLYSPWK